MKILFMSLSDYKSINSNGLYTNLLRRFVEHGDEVFILSPVERHNSFKEEQKMICESGSTIIKFKIGNIQKTNLIEKGIATLSVANRYITAINKYLSDVKFDLVLYPTPPITLLKVVEYIKKRDGAKTYLLLKDIFPQNAVDLGIIDRNGIKGVFYKYFRMQEKKLYAISDYIGCMSQANVDYVINNNPEVAQKKIEICPNSTEALDMSCSKDERIEIRKKYGIPLNKIVFVYGGNLGRPQGIQYFIECLDFEIKNEKVFFLIIGDGTEYGRLQKYFVVKNPDNMKLIKRLPKDDYDTMVGACDVGLIFLDHRFTIPNFPSRLLAYLQAKIPVLACTDTNTDIGKEIVKGHFGWWCESNNVRVFHEYVEKSIKSDLKALGENGYQYLINNYSVETSYQIIMKHWK